MNNFLSGTVIVITIAAALAYLVYSNIFALAIPAAVFERRIFFQTISRSWQLVKGDFWKVLGLRVIWTVAVYLLTYSLQGIWALIMMAAEAVTGGGFGSSFAFVAAGNLMQSFSVILIGFIVGPLNGILTALLYFNQRISKEGMDIEIMLECLEIKDKLTQ